MTQHEQNTEKAKLYFKVLLGLVVVALVVAGMCLGRYLK